MTPELEELKRLAEAASNIADTAFCRHEAENALKANCSGATILSLIARVEAAEARVRVLKEALKPFAAAAQGFDHPRVKNPDEWMAYSGIGTGGIGREGAITVTHLRAARTALGDTND